jgi:endo-1,4-beta-xylanase
MTVRADQGEPTDGAQPAGAPLAAAPVVGDAAYAHRLADSTLTLRDAHGQPLARQIVTVEQTRHAFAFGNIGFDLIPFANDELTAGSPGDGAAEDAQERAQRLARQWLALFDTATLPFYWSQFEPRRGAPDTVRLRRTAEWFAQRGVRLKGHPLVWHTLAPPWLRDEAPASVEETVRDRIRRDVTDFAGLIDTWDAINEVVIMPVFTKEDNAITRLAAVRGRVEMVRLAFETAREANPAARLVLNDFDLSADYEQLIEECLAAGIAIDALGLQTHMHQGYHGEAVVTSTVDRFARFGLPLQLTETTLVSGDLMPAHIVDLNDYVVDSWPSTVEGEARQADEIVRHYRSLVAQPAVESVTYWGLTDEGAWLGAPAGLVRADGTEKPSYDALHRLVRGEWWLVPTMLRTDDAGQLRVHAFAGDYRISLDAAQAAVTLPTGDSSIDVTLAA